MRRALYLFAVLVAGAVSTASAQARARIAARLDVQASPPNLLVHISDLLEDPVWLDALHNAYKIRVHWRVQLWRSRTLFDEPQLPIEWDDIVQQVPVLDVYTYTEPGGSTPMTTRFDTLDKLKDWVSQDVRLNTPATLRAGRWYYVVDATISTVAPDETNSSVSETLRRLVLGGGPRQDLSQARTAYFTIRR
ncbi:MAG TPA: hypothetical protein VID74_01855 [Gemmatimonadales bacterium]